MKRIIFAAIAIMMMAGSASAQEVVKVEKVNANLIQRADTAKVCLKEAKCKKAQLEKMECANEGACCKKATSLKKAGKATATKGKVKVGKKVKLKSMKKLQDQPVQQPLVKGK